MCGHQWLPARTAGEGVRWGECLVRVVNHAVCDGEWKGAAVAGTYVRTYSRLLAACTCLGVLLTSTRKEACAASFRDNSGPYKGYTAHMQQLPMYITIVSPVATWGCRAGLCHVPRCCVG
jgi:hypothetical protein